MTKQSPQIRSSGSEKRQRSDVVSVRLLEEESKVLRQKASEAGMSVASYLRSRALGSPGVRSRRSPSFNAKLLAIAVAELNKTGSNLNAITRQMKLGGNLESEMVAETLSAVKESIDTLLSSVGRKGRP